MQVPADAGSMPNQVPGNLAPRKRSRRTPEQRLTRVGENSACKLHAILQKKFPSTQRSAGGNLILGNNDIQLVCVKLTSMSTPDSNSYVFESANAGADVSRQIRDISEVPAIEVITTAAVHLMSAAAVKLGLAAEDNAEELKDLDEARKLITALAGLVTAAAPEIGSQHAGPLRDGLRSLQLAFREESLIPDAPGKGPGEKYTGAVN
jgi:hypothetical protein